MPREQISGIEMTRGKRTRTKLGWRWLTALGMTMSLVAGIVATESARAEGVKKILSAPSADSLAKYATDLTTAAEQGKFNSITERSDETERAIQVLAGNHKNNPVVISDSQALGHMVAPAVARRNAQGDVPDALFGKRRFNLNVG